MARMWKAVEESRVVDCVQEEVRRLCGGEEGEDDGRGCGRGCGLG